MPMTSRLSCLAIYLFARACSTPPPEPTVQLEVWVHDDMDAALAGVSVSMDGVQVASTDAQGRARAMVVGSHAGKVQVAARCPPQHRPLDPRSVPLGAQVHTLTVRLVCKPLERTLAIVVRAPGGQGAVVRADGEPVGRIDAEGVLHAVVQRAPESSLRLTIDTSAQPQLIPQHPVREVQVADRDDIVVFDQAFALAQPRPRARRARKAPEPTPLPYAIRRAPR